MHKMLFLQGILVFCPEFPLALPGIQLVEAQREKWPTKNRGEDTAWVRYADQDSLSVDFSLRRFLTLLPT